LDEVALARVEKPSHGKERVQRGGTGAPCLAQQVELLHSEQMTKNATIIASAALLLLGGCDRTNRTPSTAPNTAAQKVALEKEVAGMEETARLAVANKRLDELEAEVETLKADQSSADVAMLKQRLESVELSVYSKAIDQPNTGAARTKEATSVSVSAKPSVRLVADNKAAAGVKTSRILKPATKADVEAFEKGNR